MTAELTQRAGSAAFESMYEVYGVAKAGMNAKQVFVAPRPGLAASYSGVLDGVLFQ